MEGQVDSLFKDNLTGRWTVEQSNCMTDGSTDYLADIETEADSWIV